MTKHGAMAGAALALVMVLGGVAHAADPITPPDKAFAQPVGGDYFLADYTAYEAYLKTLAGQSDRMKLIDIGKTEEGRAQWMAIVSSPANLAKLDHYKDIAKRLAKAEGVGEEEARKLAVEGKAVVWIDAGLHANETVTSQGQIQVLYKMLTQSDPETLRFLDDCIILFAHDNPDGMEMISDWYMRNEDPKTREFNSLPRLYHKYIGHDNNRDSFMAAMAETTNINRQLFREWYPQIVYNQHQTAPNGMVVFVPPFRDPANYNYDPLVMTTLQEVGMAMHSRLVSEDKPGSGARSAAPYSTWHNGMERSIAYFHNSVGLLTEITGGPTPAPINLVPEVQLPSNDRPMPIAPQLWRLQQTLDYQWTLNRSVLDYASRNRERMLFNIWKMGDNSIKRGGRDSWTITPTKVDALTAAGKTKPLEGARGGSIDPSLYKAVLQAPEQRDPRGFILPADQADMPTVVAFLNALIKAGVDVDQADKAFTVAGKTYPAGSYVVRAAQAYRPHVMDMFEPQDHPHDTEYPGGPPKAPYDVTGYTLAYQMGVKFDRVLDGFEAPTRRVPDLITVQPGQIRALGKGSGKAGWLISHETNASFTLTNRLLKAGAGVQWLKDGTKIGKTSFGPGTIWVPASPAAAGVIAQGVKDLGVDAYAVGAKPAGQALPLKPIRVGLVDVYGGSMPSGWNRWMFEKFEAPFQVVYPQRLDAGDLNKDFDVLVFADGVVPAPADGPFKAGRGGPQPKPEEIPAEYRAWLGRVSDDKTLPQIAAFARAGGTVVAIGASTRLATALGAPVEVANARSENGVLRALPNKELYIPGSVLRAKVDNRQPLAYGLPADVDVFFDRSPTFTLKSDATGVSRVSWFDSDKPLRSGWAVGQEKLKGSTAILDIDLGKGKLFAMGPEVTQRAQSYGTFKFLFNGLLYGPAIAATR